MTPYHPSGKFPFMAKQRLTLREARRKRGMTQQALEQASGITQQNISKIERGDVIDPLFSTGLALADALQVDPHALKFGREVSA